jgi:hypothetical protein
MALNRRSPTKAQYDFQKRSSFGDFSAPTGRRDIINCLSAAPSGFYLGMSSSAIVYSNPECSVSCLGLAVIDIPCQPPYLTSEPCFRVSAIMFISAECIKAWSEKRGVGSHKTSCIRHHTSHVNRRISSHQWWSSHQITGLCRFHRLLRRLYSVGEPLLSSLTFSLLGPAVWRMCASGSRTIIIVSET